MFKERKVCPAPESKVSHEKECQLNAQENILIQSDLKKSKDEKSDEENGKATNGAPIGRPHMAARMRYMRGKHEESTLPETFL